MACISMYELILYNKNNSLSFVCILYALTRMCQRLCFIILLLALNSVDVIVVKVNVPETSENIHSRSHKIICEQIKSHKNHFSLPKLIFHAMID